MRVERSGLVVAIVLGTGGWVCESADTNPCPGALACAVDVASVCCPFGQPYACGGLCLSDPTLCSDGAYACADEAPSTACAFSATIVTASCSDPIGGPTDINWHVRASGTVTGCADEGIYIAKGNGMAFGGLQCGSWSPGMFATSCMPDADPTTTTWSIDEVVFPVYSGTSVELAVRTGSGSVLATTQTVCD